MTYIDEYVDRLRSIRSEREIYEDLARWQEEQFPEQQRGAVNGINTALGLSGPELLQADHLPTTAIGSLRGLVVVSANPGHHDVFNLRENAARLSGGNGDFCRQFFQRYPECVSKRRDARDGVAFRPEKDGRTIRYWTYAMGLWSLAFGDAADLGLRGYERWKAAVDGQWALGGVDLLPFHSNRDGVTARLGRTEAAQLTKIAIETLKMVVALPVERRSGDSMHTRIVLVSSKHGAKLVEALVATKAVSLRGDFEAPWGVKLYESDDATRVLVIPYQVFSRAAPRDCTRERLADLLRRVDRVL